jgi:hypothetical protein
VSDAPSLIRLGPLPSLMIPIVSRKGSSNSVRPLPQHHWPPREDSRDLADCWCARGLLVPSRRGRRRGWTQQKRRMAVREWHGRVKAIFAANERPITREGLQNAECPRCPIGRLHLQASRLHPAIADWLRALQRRGLAARDSRTTAIPPPFQPTEEEAAGGGLTLGGNPSHTLSLSCRTTEHRSQCSRPIPASG